MELTQELLKSLLHYDPETGVFTWIKARKGTRVGRIADHVSNRGYVEIRVRRRLYKAQRLAFLYMTGKWPAGEMDHRNEIKTDNRWRNLRDGTHQDNCQNQRKPTRASSTGIRGVMWYKQTQRWHVQIHVDGRKIHLGYFTNQEDAQDAYLVAKKRLHTVG